MAKRVFADMKLRQKMILVSVVSVALVWIACVGAASSSITEIYRKKLDHIIRQTVEQTSRYVNTEYQNIINLAHYSAVDEGLQGVLTLDVANDRTDYIVAQSVIVPILTQIQLRSEFIDSMGLYLKGTWFYGDNYSMNYDISQRMEAAQSRFLIYWSEEQVLNEGTGNMVLPIIMRIPNGSFSAKNEAYMVININADRMFSYLESLETSLDCYLVIHRDQKVILGDEYLFQHRGDAGYVANANTIHINDWTISCIMDRNLLFEDLNRAMQKMVAVSLAVLFCCVFLAMWVAKTVTNPIYSLMQKVKEFENGDFTVRSHLRGKDEIGELGQSFNSMCTQIEGYIAMLEEEKRQVARVEENKRKAEMRVLQAQINPHFLYNTLDSLYWYSISGKKDEIGQIVVDLSQMLRIGLSKGSEEISVEQELKHVENYLRIQKVIFSDKFDYEIVCGPDVGRYRIVKILLQPLAENSMVHGFADMESMGRIRVRAEIEGSEMVFRVTDNGCGFGSGANSHKSPYSGYAFKNIEERLKLHYGGDASIRVTSIPYEETTVEIRIRLERMEG